MEVSAKKGADRTVFKLIVIGKQGAGKSCLANIYTQKLFKPHYNPTIGMEFQSKELQLGGRRVLLQIWDTAGQEKFHAIVRKFYRGVSCVVFVYALDDPDWLQSLQFWIEEIRQHADGTPLLVLIGNKDDLPRQVSRSEGEGVKSANSIDLFFETNAKDYARVKAIFEEIALALLDRRRSLSMPDPISLNSGEANRAHSKGRCC